MITETIRCNGEQKLITEWGIESCSLQVQCGGYDSLTFTTTEEIGTAARFPAFAPIELFDTSGARLFSGNVYRIKRGAGDRSRIRTYHCPSPMLRLERLPVAQQWKVVTENVLGQKYITTTLLGKDTVHAELQDILNLAITQDFAPIRYRIEQVPTERNPDDKQRDLKVADYIRKVLGWAPYLSCRWNYEGVTGTLPELHFFSQLRSGLEYGLPSNPFAAREIRPSDVENFTGDPRYDLLKQKVKINYLRRIPFELGGTRFTSLEVVEDEAIAAPANSAFGREECTIDLRRGEFNAETGTYEEDPPVPVGLARRLGAAYFSLWYDFQWQQTGQNCNWSVKPGELWSVVDGDPEFANARAICQVVTHDLRTRTTSVQCGPPFQLGLGNVRDLIKPNRVRTSPARQDGGFQNWGFGENEPDEGEGGENTVDVTVCDGGVENTYTFVIK